MKPKIFDYETIRLTSRRPKAKHLWSSAGHNVSTYRRTKAGKVSKNSVQHVIHSHAWSIPLHAQFIEAVVVDGVPVYTADEKSDFRPTTYPLSGGGRFRYIRTLCDGQTVQRTLYIQDLPREAGETQDIRVVFGWHKKVEQENKDEQDEKYKKAKGGV